MFDNNIPLGPRQNSKTKSVSYIFFFLVWKRYLILDTVFFFIVLKNDIKNEHNKAANIYACWKTSGRT